MKGKDVLDFVKVEHTLFSLPFVLIGFILARKEFEEDVFHLPFELGPIWIIIAAIGARGWPWH